MHKTCDVGDLMRTTGYFYQMNESNVKVSHDPTVVGVMVRDPAGDVTTYEMPDPVVVKDSVGHYHADVGATMHGRYYFRWYSTGSGQAAGEDYFVVRESNVLI